jgi:DNA modification methylase
MAENTLYFGDNLKILRDNNRDETVDLIYLDPPFNFQANYNPDLNRDSPKGHELQAQNTAFESRLNRDWHWGEFRRVGKAEFTEVINHPNTDVSRMMDALRRFLVASNRMAYMGRAK